MTNQPSLQKSYERLVGAVFSARTIAGDAINRRDIEALNNSTALVKSATKELSESFERNTVVIRGKGKVVREEYEALHNLAKLNGRHFANIVPGVLEVAYSRVISINLRNMCLSNVAPLSSFNMLSSLILASNQLRDVTPLSALQQLTELHLCKNQLIEIQSLATLTQLTTLGLSNNRLADIAALSSLVQLRELDLGGNNLVSVDHLSGLSKLESLTLSDNKLTDIMPISGATQLKYLCLRNNRITDVSTLSRLSQLHNLIIEGNPINNAEPNCTALAQLKAQGCIVQYANCEGIL